MGLFGGGNQAELKLPAAPTLQTGAQARGTALEFGQAQTPLALGARESALADIGRGTEFFEQFQPTSFEQALGQQSFQNIFPDVERSIRQNLSLSGIESSPVLAQQVGRARGQLGVDIGNILAQLGQQRATQSLQARLGIDPISQIINPISQQDLQQSNLQSQLQFQRDLAQSLADFQTQQQAASSKSAGISSLGSALGAGAGALFAIPTGGLSIPAGAALGGALGGAGASLFGGGASPIGLGDALSVIQAFPGTSGASTPQTPQGRAGTVQGVFDQQDFNFPSESNSGSIFGF